MKERHFIWDKLRRKNKSTSVQRGYSMEENNREKASFTKNKDSNIDAPRGI